MDPLAGLRLPRSDRVLRVTLGAAIGALLFISAALAVEIFYIKDVVGASDTAYATLVCVWMVGMACGATALARRVPVRMAACGALVALAAQGAGMGIQTTWAFLPVACTGYLMGGIGHGVKNILLRALITARVPDAVHGRAFAAYTGTRNIAELGAVGAGGLLVSGLGPLAALLLGAVGAGGLLVSGLGPLAALLLGAVGAGGLLVSGLGPLAALLLAGLGPMLAAVAGLSGLRGRDLRVIGRRHTPVAATNHE
jgi:hypothetical protein